MKYPKLTIFLGIVVVLIAWFLIAGMEGKREAASLGPMSGSAGTGAVLVIGGTRATGLEIVKVLRARGDEVVVLVRPASDASAAEATGARIFRGDAMNPADMTAALSGGQFRAVVSTLGATSVTGPRPDFEGNRNAVDAARLAGVKRFVLVSVIGAGESLTAAPWIARRFIKAVIFEKTKAEDYLKTSGLDYTIIRPVSTWLEAARLKSRLKSRGAPGATTSRCPSSKRTSSVSWVNGLPSTSRILAGGTGTAAPFTSTWMSAVE